MKSISTTRLELLRNRAGFVLPSAIFLLVVLASLGAFMLHVSSGSQVSNALDIQGARAYQAARVGVEAGLYRLHRTGACPTVDQNIDLDNALEGFTAVWKCSAAVTHNENGTTFTLHQITSTAEYGSVNSPDYVQREIVVTTER